MIIINNRTRARGSLSFEGIFPREKNANHPPFANPYRARCEAGFACQFAIPAIPSPFLFAAFVRNDGAFNRDHPLERERLPPFLSLFLSRIRYVTRRRSFAAITAAVPAEK